MQKGLIFVFAKLVLLWEMGSVKMLTSAKEVCAKRMPIVSILLALTNATVEVASFPTDRTVLISTSVLAIDITATPTRCAPTLRALIIAFVKKATSVTDFSARKKANKRKEQNQDAQSKKKKRKAAVDGFLVFCRHGFECFVLKRTLCRSLRFLYEEDCVHKTGLFQANVSVL